MYHIMMSHKDVVDTINWKKPKKKPSTLKPKLKRKKK